MQIPRTCCALVAGLIQLLTMPRSTPNAQGRVDGTRFGQMFRHESVRAASTNLPYLTAAAPQQDSSLVAPDRVQIRAMPKIAAVEVVPGVLVRTVVATTASFSLADFGPGSIPPAHHHEREQIDVGITGTFDVILGNRTEAVGPGEGVIIPS